MKQTLVIFLNMLMIMIVSPAFADDGNLTITVDKAYAFATSSAQKNGAVFMTVHNASTRDVKLTGAKTGVADSVELHTHIHEDEVMMMRQVTHYTIPAQGVHALVPSGDHIMLIGLHAPLEKNTSFPLTLFFEDAPSIDVDVRISGFGEMP